MGCFSERSPLNQPICKVPVFLYSILFGILSLALMILYVAYLKIDILEHLFIFIIILMALNYDMLLPVYIMYAAGTSCFLHFRSHACQKAMIIIWTIIAAGWTALLIYIFIILPISFDYIFEYVVLIVTISHSILVAVVAYMSIRSYRRFVSDAQELNPGMSFVDARALYELVMLRKLFTKPIQVFKDKYGREYDNGQLRAFHWDDFYHLHRWIRELNRGDGGLEFVVTEMENRLNIYDVAIGGWRLAPTSSAHAITGHMCQGRNQLKDKLAALHADDHCQLWHWSQLLRSVPNMPTIGERISAIETVTDQMQVRATLYDVKEEAKIWLISLSRHGRHLKVPYGESVEDPKPFGVQVQRVPMVAVTGTDRVGPSANEPPAYSRNDHIDFDKY